MRALRLARAGEILFLSLTLGGGCDNASGPRPGTGAISVSVTTTGIDLDVDGYTVNVDGVAGRPIDADGTVTFVALSEGDHVVTLSGVAQNCTIGETNPQSITVTAGASAVARFVVTCAAGTGTIRVTATTVGNYDDSDGYAVEVRASAGFLTARESIKANGSVNVAAIAVGSHVVTLAAVTANCEVAGGATRQVEVTAGTTVEVAFAVTCTAVSPIAFVGDDQIYVINSDGTGLRRLTSTGRNWAPTWSPDGQRIAFVSDRAAGFQLHVMNADGSNVVRRPSSTSPSYYPTWSPDGLRIAFVGIQNGDAEIYVTSAAADETVPVRLTNHPGADIDPAWSPDGSTIAFASDRDGPLDVYTMSPDGTIVRRLTSGIPSVSSAHLPAWSPDGRRIAFATEQCSTTIRCPFVAWWDYGDFPDFTVQVMNADGSSATVLVSTPSRNNVSRMSFTSRPAWSPDGLTLAFSREYSGGSPTSLEFIGTDGSSNRGGVITYGGHSPSWRW